MTVIPIRLLSSTELLDRWPSVAPEIHGFFAGAAMNSGWAEGRPAEHTRSVLTGQDSGKFVHALAIDATDEVRGALFCIPSLRQADEDADPGWFSTSPKLASEDRRRLADNLWALAHEVMRCAGFSRVVTSMGTEAGARFLATRHGYVHEPTEDEDNRWVREL